MNSIRKSTFYVLICAFLSLGVQAPAMADMVTNQEISADARAELQRDRIQQIVAREDVRQKLSAMGVSEADVQQRLDNMTQQELGKLHQQFNDLPAGEGFLGAVIAILVIFMLLDIAGATDIFPSI